MGNTRKSHPPSFKLEVAIQAAAGTCTLAELSSKYGVHATEICRWKQQLKAAGQDIFTKNPDKLSQDQSRLIQQQQLLIGKQTMMLEEAKKKLGC